MKEKYIVRSGNINTTVKARNNQMACILAIDKKKNWKLGVIMASKKVDQDDSEELYVKTESILQAMGIKKAV